MAEQPSSDPPVAGECKTSVLFCGSTAWDLMGRKAIPKEVLKRGGGEYGQEVLEPAIVPELEDVDVVKVVAGPVSCHVLALTRDGKVYAWGRNDSGQLGFPDLVRRNRPTLVTALDKHHIVEAACGRNHTILIAKDGTAFAMGLNKSSQLGLGTMSKDMTANPAKVKLNDLANNGATPTKVSCGADFSVILGSDGSLYSFGLPQYGQLGHNTDGQYFVSASKLTWHFEMAPRRIVSLVKPEKINIVDIQCGANSCVALDDKGQMYTWGFGGYGRLGHGGPKDEFVPKCVEQMGRNKGIRGIFSGASCVYAVSNIDQTLMFGQTKKTGEANMHPKPIQDLTGWKVRSICCGPTSTMVAADSSVVSWGPSPCYGELGYGDKNPVKSSTKPKLVDALEGSHTFAVTMGTSFSVILVRKDTEDDKELLGRLAILQEEELPAVTSINKEAAGTKRKRAPAKGKGGKKK